MEFKLNKIDTDIRRKLKENTSLDKIHKKDSIDVKKETEEYDNKRRYTKEKNDMVSTKRFLTVDGIRYEQESLKIQAEKIEFRDAEYLKGNSVNTRK